KLVNRVNLSEAETIDVMNQIMTGEATPLQVASFLTALRVKGETVEEITGAARVMREKAHRVNVGSKTVLDTCGTGGDQKGTFNISTASAFVVAGAGVNVAKHGNRSVSSQSGSADVLGALGVKIDAPKERVEACIDKVGIGFLFAPLLHEAMKYAVQPRRDIGIRTVFNLLGPLTNPAMASHQLLGLYSGELVGVVAHVLKNLGSVRAMAEFLATLARHVRDAVERRRRETPLSALRDRRFFHAPARGFAAALTGNSRRIIAEIKRASPSRGLIRADFDAVAIARDYASHG